MDTGAEVTATILQLIQRVNATTVDDHSIMKLYPKVFTGLGTLGEEYHIKQKENVVPHALYVPGENRGHFQG